MKHTLKYLGVKGHDVRNPPVVKKTQGGGEGQMMKQRATLTWENLDVGHPSALRTTFSLETLL